MNTYRETLNKRLKWSVAFNGLAIALIAITFWIGQALNQNSTMEDGMVTGFQVGIFIGLQAVMLYGIIRYRKALKDDTLLKAMYIQETDERSRWLQGKIGSMGLKLILSGIMIAMIIAGFFNLTVLLTLFAVLLFVLFVQLGLKVFYQNKY